MMVNARSNLNLFFGVKGWYYDVNKSARYILSLIRQKGKNLKLEVIRK